MSHITNGDLKKQFEQLQAQQKKKFAARKQKKDATNVEKKADPASSFGVDDDLGLKTLKDENGRLYKLLSERDMELRLLRKKNEEHQAKFAGTGGATNETASAKIVELSKKVRELNSDVSKERTQNVQLQKRCIELENDLARAATGVKVTTAKEGEKAPPSEMKLLQDKVKQLELRLAETRNNSELLKKELKMAHKVLGQEVGENFNISQLLSNSSGGWRGRSTQIIALQKKVNELRGDLADLSVTKGELKQQTKDTNDDNDDIEAQFMGTSRRNVSQDENRKDDIRRMEKERKEQQEKMVKEFKAMEADYEVLKNKHDASKARNKVLSNELKGLKDQVKTLLDKEKHDNELIDALFKQQANYKTMLGDVTKQREKVSDKEAREENSDEMRKQREANVIEQLKVIISERENKVKQLENELKQAQMATEQRALSRLFEDSTSPRRMPSRAESGELSLRTLSAQSSPPTQRTGRRSDSAAMVTNDGDEERLATARSGRSSTATLVNDVRQSARGKSDSASQRLQLELQETQTMLQATLVERDKLHELLQMQLQRVAQAEQEAATFQSEVQAEKRRCVQIEKQLGKARVDQESARGGKRKSTGKEVTSENRVVAEELETRLAIQQDENEALKAALQSTLTAKTDDLKLYTDMVEETKRIFLQGLRQYRNTASNA